MQNSNIRNCIRDIGDKEVNNEHFAQCIFTNAHNQKVISGNIPIIDTKQVNDELTNITNNLLISQFNKTNLFMYQVYSIFGELDNDELTPYEIGKTRHKKMNIGMYFVFKGGNSIKLWVNKTYLQKMGDLTTNLQDILSNKIAFHENEAINASSDFDFSLYIDFKDNTNYGELLEYIGTRFFILRHELNQIISDNIINNYRHSSALKEKIRDYIILKNKRKIINIENIIKIDNIELNLVTEGNDFILTMNNNNNNPIKYDREVKDKQFISFNNIIKNNIDDFDLFRIKLGMVAKYNTDNLNYRKIFKSEVFDLSILRKEDTKLNKMYKDINEYTKIISLQYNNYIVPIRLYNNKYILIDILRMFFINAPWLDIKYNKRLIRLAIITSLYNQENFVDSQINDGDNDEDIIKIKKNKHAELFSGLFNLLNILNIIHILDILTNYPSNYNNKLFKHIIQNNLNIIKNDEVFTDLFITDLNKIIDGKDGYDDLNYYKTNFIYEPNKFFCLIILVFIRKIIIESNKNWYINIIDPTFPVFKNFNDIKDKVIKFLKTYIYYLLNSTFCLTNIKTLFHRYINNRFNLPDFVGGVSVGQQTSDVNIEKNMIIGSTDILDQRKQNIDKRSTKSRYGFVKIDQEQQSLDKKFIELDKKLKYNLSKLYEINDYFVDVNHEYILNSKMEPEIIREIKDERNITDVFNILKDILQLDKNIYFKDEDTDEDY
jgi:hypothetical protein